VEACRSVNFIKVEASESVIVALPPPFEGEPGARGGGVPHHAQVGVTSYCMSEELADIPSLPRDRHPTGPAPGRGPDSHSHAPALTSHYPLATGDRSPSVAGRLTITADGTDRALNGANRTSVCVVLHVAVFTGTSATEMEMENGNGVS
jgi:hypothetical protein